MLERLKKIREGGYVSRYHTFQLIGGQSVAEHTFGVLCILFQLYGTTGIGMNLVVGALYHDVIEKETGDIPRTAKDKFPYIGAAIEEAEQDVHLRWNTKIDLSNEQRRRLKFADTVEGALFCIDQIRLGNKNLNKVLSRYISYSTELAEESCEVILMRDIQEEANNV